MKNRTRAFTLIELLVVIAILAVLAALAFPAVGGAVSSSQRASALNSIKQISTLAVTYAADHNGLLPEEGGEGVQSFSRVKSATNAWYNVLPPLAGLKAAREHDRFTFHGPESLFFVKGAKYPARTGSSAYFAYGINSQLMDNTRTRIRLHQITHPARRSLRRSRVARRESAPAQGRGGFRPRTTQGPRPSFHRPPQRRRHHRLRRRPCRGRPGRSCFRHQRRALGTCRQLNQFLLHAHE